MNTIKELGNKKGVTIIIVLFMILFLGAMGIALSNITQSQQMQVERTLDNQGGYYAVQSGVEWAIQRAVCGDGGSVDYCSSPSGATSCDGSASWSTTAQLDALNGLTGTLPNGSTYILGYDSATDILTSSSPSTGTVTRQVQVATLSAKIPAGGGGGSPTNACSSGCSFPGDGDDFWPWDPNGPTYTDLGDVKLQGGETFAFGPGVFVINDFDVKGNSTLTITGPVTIYVRYEFNITGSNISTLNGDVNFFVDSDVYVGGSSTMDATNVNIQVASPNTMDIDPNILDCP